MNRRNVLKNTALLGGAALLSTSSLAALMQSCQEQPRLTWEPKFLSTEQAQLVSALVDVILPATDTPGGLDVKVDMAIDLIYLKSLTPEQQQQTAADLDQFNANCVSQFGKPFHQLDKSQQVSVLEAEEEKAPMFSPGVWGTRVGDQPPVGFYRSFKSLAVMAYCTSEQIGKEVLNYDPVPGPYQGCIPFSEVGKVWSLG